MSHRRPQRLPSFNYAGQHCYFLTMCVLRRQPLFTSAETVRAASTQFLRAAAEQEFAVLAYTFMPDHFHAVVEGTDAAADLRRFVSLFRKRATLACCRPGRRLWQNGYYERVLWPGANVLTVIDYVINNPVRAGLVDKATDYSFSWSVTFRR